ncbi:MAG TPA: ATP phosphoribosyltransferase regulatory subunit [Thermoanaerobaculia bacterium]|nr:ATP phosphoribosyltransferase regulatory subunit [Thermoanaerobaculia bacterium]
MTTISTDISYPVGVRALLVDETARRRKLEARVVDRFEASGYGEIILPMIDFVEPYAALGDAASGPERYRFTDREGELVAIRSDFTPMVARVLAPALGTLDLPLRVFYRGDVIRWGKSRLGLNREFFQIGIESIGADSAEADIEMLTIAAETAAAIGQAPTITWTDVSLAESLLEAIPEQSRLAIRRALANKQTGELAPFRDLLASEPWEILRHLIAGSIDTAMLSRFAPTSALADRIETTRRAVSSIRAARIVLTLDDLDETSSYYTGLRFRIFTGGRQSPVGGGGRYDRLYGFFGRSAPAIGFTLSLDELEQSS